MTILSLDKTELPEFLKEEEVQELIEQAKDGDKEARNNLIVHNLRSVSWVVNVQFKNLPFNKEDIFNEGTFGLFKAIDSYNIEKGNFVTYSTRCIINQVLMYLRKMRKDKDLLSTDDDLLHLALEHKNENDDGYECVNNKDMLNSIISRLEEREQIVILNLYGINTKPIKQREVGEMIGLTQPAIARMEKRIIKKIRGMILDDGLEIKMA